MKEENAIEVHNITKNFKVYLDKGHTIKEKVLFSKRRKYEERSVLKGISFNVKKGEAVGLIGENGCGKSTTLKLLTRIMYPDSGTIETKGRVSSLIELGAGFHPDMSGRQNIYINASIFGLSRKEIEDRIPAIIAFSELEQFIDNPVRTYSSGMYMRLAFAVAINVDADILLIDEILAVGDTNFQEKCFNKLRDIKRRGTTIVIVSHSLGQIEQICERSIWIHEGRIRAEGTPRDVHPQYLDYMGRKNHQNNTVNIIGTTDEKKEELKEQHEELETSGRWGNKKARITGISIKDKAGKICNTFKTGEAFCLEINYKVKEKIENAVFGIGIFRSDGVQCYGTNTRIEKFEEFDLVKDGKVEIYFKGVELLPGEYNLDIAIESGQGIPVDYYTKACSIQIYSVIGDVGICRIEHTWNIENIDYKRN